MNEAKRTHFRELVSAASREELSWMSGYLSALLEGVPDRKGEPVSSPTPLRLTITYGTETGNSKKLATRFAARARQNGIPARLMSLDQYPLQELPGEDCFLTVLSTQGDGEPPATARKFYDGLQGRQAELDGLRFGVLALGDTSYPQFCKAGADVDEQLDRLGARRILPLQKCDTDYESDAEAWFGKIMQQLASGSSDTVQARPEVKKPGGKKAYAGRIARKINLNDRGSNKETWHIEIEAEDVDYQPGDALGLVPSSPNGLAEAILEAAGADPDLEVLYAAEKIKAHTLLSRKLNITNLPQRVVQQYAKLTDASIPDTAIGLLDLLRIYPLKSPDQFPDLIALLEKTAPRLYSISSSPLAHPGTVHITVARDRFEVNGQRHYGLCSDYLARCGKGDQLSFYIHANPSFRLPDEDRDLIMIGPGTGIAPFRSFLAHRESRGDRGRNWLFFGEQHFVTDFLYQTEIQDWLETGVLTRASVAFSRDQPQPIYVQHRMREETDELLRWIHGGASVYVCGKKDPMSRDVESTLLHILGGESGVDETEARSRLASLKEEGRLIYDVY